MARRGGDASGAGRVQNGADVSPRSCSNPTSVRRSPKAAEYTRSGVESGNPLQTGSPKSAARELAWCRGRDSNPHVFPRAILSRLRMPFRHPGDAGNIALMNELVHSARHLRAGALGAGVDNTVLAVDEHNLGLVRPRLFVAHFAERRDDG